MNVISHQSLHRSLEAIEEEEWVVVEKKLPSAADDGRDPVGDCDLLKVEFFEPAIYWTEALPLGNGRLGAMVFGGVPLELVMLNHDTLYTGGPKDWNNPSAIEVLPQVRKAVFDGHYTEASSLAGKMLGPYCQMYQPLGAFDLDFGDSHSDFDPDSYHRQLDLDTATVSIEYSVGDVKFTREYFTSQPHQVLAVRLSADKAKSVSFGVTLMSPLQEGVATCVDRQLRISGRAPGDVVDDTVTGMGMAFAVALEVRTGGSSGIVEACGDQSLSVKNVDWAVILLASSTSFDGPFKNPVLTDRNPAELVLATLKGTEGLGFETLRTSHLNDYQPLFRSVSLRLAKSAEEFLRPKAESQKKLSTRDRVGNFKENQDPRMVTLLFQFGRYLMLSSSRPRTFVSNLQGIWNKDLSPAWRCVPHININLPMNYWPAETCNLGECHEPLFDTIETMAINGRITAQVNYGLEGWVGHHNVDIWGQTAPVGGDPVWAFWPMGGAWLCLHMWEHYCFSLDEDFLKNRAYTLMKGCTEFLLGWLIEDDSRNLVTNPSTSPEHYFISPDTGNWASVTSASTMDLTIITELFKAAIKADQILGGLDTAFTRKLGSALDRLYPVKLTHDGCVIEWGREFEDPEENHRHLSHLFGLFPGHSISPVTTPQLCDAATKSILKRGETGPGWSMAWKIALWGRLWNAEYAYGMVVRMFTLIGPDETTESLDGGGLYCNLFNAHPPFQIDGNFGFTGALAELFLQSDGESLYLLPALPVEAWPYGKVEGLRGRGSVTISITWEEGKIVEVDIDVEVKSTDLKNVYYQGRSASLSSISPSYVYTYDKDLKLQRTSRKQRGSVIRDGKECRVL
ncbi:hypothetical protein R1flu_015188 [Riccia fluitans]|uniref:Glycosyl hydrolase family 95 N-terminal domain-containing protein n=1 Tax=Riccia fluitans TaxID=41844 RepID=A0ABD1YM07_9MARC